MLPANELKPIMTAQIQEVTEVLGVPHCAATILMREHKWAKERLFESFLDNPEKVQEKCCVLARCQGGSGGGGDGDGDGGGGGSYGGDGKCMCKVRK